MSFVIAGNSASTGYNLTRSLRFRSSASAYLNRTPAGAGNRKTFTWSGWVKRGALGINGTLFANGNGVSANGYFTIRFNTNDTISIFNDNDGTLTTCDWSFTNVFRDVAAWYHLVLAIDTTQATQTNRLKLYVNGVQNTNNSVVTYPAQNSDFNINRTVPHQIGQFGFGSSQYFDGYLTEVNFIDGQALTPSSFGSTNTLTGVWQPARYTGTYGTNGFYLPFTDNSALTTSSNVGLGKDFSGNGNYWTTNNISLTGGTLQSFTTVGTTSWTAPAGVTQVNYLVVAGGGAGKTDNGGGGGAGGLLQGQLTVVPGNSYTVTVGAGGTAATTPSNGGNSVFASLTAIGGGGGSGFSGGSGGGAGSNSGSGGAGTSGQGNAGGSATSIGNGGGGGAGAAGGNGTSTNGGAGGAGITSSITGTAIVYAGGGGGGSVGGTAGAGGSGGGGAGTSDASTATAGTANRGGGGGGGGYGAGPGTGGAGGSGIVIISYGAGVTYDSMTDVPTLTSATAANFAVLNAVDSGRTLSNGNLTYAGAASGITKATFGVSSGKWYWEFTAGNTECMVGLCAITLAPTTSWIGSSSGGWGYFGTTGLKYVGGSSSSYGASYTTNDIIGVAFDADNGTLAFYKNGTSQGTAFTGITGSTYCPANGNNSTSDSGSLNFGQRPFAYTPPTGFVALNTFNIAAGTVTTSGSFTGNVSADGPFVYLNGTPTALTINGNAVTWGTHADKLANGFKIRTSSTLYNSTGTNTYSVTTTSAVFKFANAQGNP